MFISRKDEIIKRIIDRFDLTILNREQLVIPHTITLISSVDDLLIDDDQIHFDTVTAGSHQFLFIPPAGKKYLVRMVYMRRTSTSAMYISLKQDTEYLYLRSGASVSELYYEPYQLLPLFQDKVALSLYFGSGTSEALKIAIYYQSINLGV